MLEHGVLCLLRQSSHFVSEGGDDDSRQRTEIGNTLQEVTNPMERTQNIANLEKPTLLNSSGEITNHVLKLDQITLHSIF